MRTVVLAFLSSVSFVALTVVRVVAGDFEGVIHLRVGDPEMMVEQAWYLKGKSARQESEVEGLQTISILDGPRNKSINLVPEEKKYFESPLADLAGMNQEFMDEVEAVRTGKTDKVAGFSCEIIQSKDRQTGAVEAEYCVAKGFGDTAALWSGSIDLGGHAPMPGWLDGLIKQGAFPMRVRSLGEQGTEEFRSEVTKVERRKLPDSLFAVPAGYTKVETVNSAGGMNKPGKRKGRVEVIQEKEDRRELGVNSAVKGLDKTMKQQKGE